MKKLIKAIQVAQIAKNKVVSQYEATGQLLEEYQCSMIGDNNANWNKWFVVKVLGIWALMKEVVVYYIV